MSLTAKSNEFCNFQQKQIINQKNCYLLLKKLIFIYIHNLKTTRDTILYYLKNNTNTLKYNRHLRDLKWWTHTHALIIKVSVYCYWFNRIVRIMKPHTTAIDTCRELCRLYFIHFSLFIYETLTQIEKE